MKLKQAHNKITKSKNKNKTENIKINQIKHINKYYNTI